MADGDWIEIEGRCEDMVQVVPLRTAHRLASWVLLEKGLTLRQIAEQVEAMTMSQEMFCGWTGQVESRQRGLTLEWDCPRCGGHHTTDAPTYQEDHRG